MIKKMLKLVNNENKSVNLKLPKACFMQENTCEQLDYGACHYAFDYCVKDYASNCNYGNNDYCNIDYD